MSRVVVVLWDRKSSAIAVLGIVGLLALLLVIFKATTFVVAPPLSEAVCGKTMVIDPGHGGPDGGAKGRSGILEKDIVLDVSRRLERMLNRVAVYTVMTRTGDEVLAGQMGDDTLYWRRSELQKRMELANSSGADLFVSIHANSFPEPVWSGAQAFYHPRSEESRNLATAIQLEFTRSLGPNLRRAKPGDAYYVLRTANMPAVLVEVGFLSNPREEGLLGSPEYRQKVAEAIFRGIVNYLVEKYTKQTREPGGSREEGNIGRPVSSALAIGKGQLVLYFAGPTNFDDSLLPEIRDVGVEFSTANVEGKAKIALTELVRGPAGQSVLCRTIPAGTSIEWLDQSGGCLTISFGTELARHHWGGSRSEELTVYSVVNTLSGIPGIEKVRFLIGGREGASISGHIILDEPFEMNASIVEHAK